MKFVSPVLLMVGLVLFPVGAIAAAAVSDAEQPGEVAALEKKLSAARDELAALKTALAIAKSQTEAAELRARAMVQPDSEIASLKNQVRLLERDLQSATTALKRVAADKAAAESALLAGNQQLSGVTRESMTARPPTTGSSPRVSVGPDQKIAELQSELGEVRSRLIVTERKFEASTAELERLRAAAATVESRPPPPANDGESVRRDLIDAQQRLAIVTQELAESRNQLVAARELEARVRQLEAEKAGYLSRPIDPGVSKDEFARVTASQAEAERKLAAASDAYALLARERDELRTQVSKAGELENRIRQLESEKAGTATSVGVSSVSKEDYARVAAAQAAAESKLATVLRSFTLLTKERDELRARLAELSAKMSSRQENP